MTFYEFSGSLAAHLICLPFSFLTLLSDLPIFPKGCDQNRVTDFLGHFFFSFYI
jgi:hypothetical protein